MTMLDSIPKKLLMFLLMVSSVLALPSAASAAEMATDKASQAGTDAVVCRYLNDTLRGCASFQDYGEHLYACDERADGRSVTAQLYWSGAIRATVSDSNGAQSGCGHRNLAIAENTTVYVRVCLEGTGCSAYVPAKS